MRSSEEILWDIHRLDEEREAILNRGRQNGKLSEEDLKKLADLRAVKAAEEASLYWRSKSEKGSWE